MYFVDLLDGSSDIVGFSNNRHWHFVVFGGLVVRNEHCEYPFIFMFVDLLWHV